MDEDRRWMLLELERASDNEKRTIDRILCNKLHLHKIAAQWVPHALTEAERWLCYAICSGHFARWQQDGDQFLSEIITIDKFWDRAYEPELKSQSAEWRHARSPRRQKVRQNPSSVKLRIIVVYDVRGVIICHLFAHGKTVTAQYYRDFMVQQAQSGIRDKRPDLVDSAIILHNKGRQHKAECVPQLL
ncbi:histone-lysine N-methyltransferase SETMAR [Trichonephila clavata]|uniref:Histone-lysine N-methyltransferase SETMAR n=1 Tax=Trichonephila clavata TaxID=2740835 RepID=A0A8X6IJN1_TRICU|nr:histone-lysine N-methyltransferase SETMAR [Trichonephila clavata]